MHERFTRRPRSGVSVATARALRERMTPQEAKLWLSLRALREAGYHFRRQVPIGRFVVDFACLKRALVVEVDGGGHSFDLMIARDRARDAELAAAGFRVLRFFNSDVTRDFSSVTDTIHATLAVDHR